MHLRIQAALPEGVTSVPESRGTVPKSSLTPVINCMAFNAGGTLFAVGHSAGFSVYQCTDPFTALVDRKFDGGVDLIELCDKANLLLICPVARRDTVHVWNDALCNAKRNGVADGETAPEDADNNNHIVATLRTTSAVNGLRMRPDCIVVALTNLTHIYDEQLQHVTQLKTRPNLCGIMALAPGRHTSRCVLLGAQKGSIVIMDALKPGSDRSMIPHNNEVGCVAISHDGVMAVTASVQGTVIKVIDTEQHTVVHELRRGSTIARIFSLQINGDKSFVTCVSDSGTAHVFAASRDNTAVRNSHSLLRPAGEALPTYFAYFASEWGMTKWAGVDGMPAIAVIGRRDNGGDAHLLVAQGDGKVIRVRCSAGDSDGQRVASYAFPPEVVEDGW